MTQTFSLSCKDYQKTICNGLSFLQETGDFVDMTLAADGHYVKVHKMVLSLFSPFIKELITSTHCSHPVIFLNNISYLTLRSLLEYIYTGEVLVNTENLNEFFQAGKALHIKGLDLVLNSNITNTLPDNTDEITTDVDNSAMKNKHSVSEDLQMSVKEDGIYETDIHEDSDIEMYEDTPEESFHNVKKTPAVKTKLPGPGTTIQYTVSNQGGLQMILNRYIYSIRYSNKHSTRRVWRCIFYPRQMRCPAYVVTKDEVVVARGCSHNHGFHDKNILKKYRDGSIFCALKDAEKQVEAKKKSKISDESVEGNAE